MLLCGIDVGTTGAKAALYDPEGNLVSEGYAEYPVSYPHAGWAEQEPEEWWRAVTRATAAMMAGAPREAGRRGGVAAVAVSAQAPTLLPLDSRGHPVRPAMIWMDRRAEAEAVELRERFGERELFELTGNRPDPFYVAPKILWYRHHEPEAFRETRLYAQIPGYIVHRLTGAWSMDPVHAALLGLRSWQGEGWSETLCDYCGVEPAQFPPTRQGSEPVGRVTRAAAAECGLAAETLVVAGSVDGSAAALEAGAVQPGVVAEMTGTSTVLLMPNAERLTAREFIAMPHAIEGASLLLGAMSSTGASLKWFRDQLGDRERAEAAADGSDAYDALGRAAAGVEAGSGGVVFLPYMMGERAPIWDSNARGVFFGLSLQTRREQLIRAIMEGASFALRHNAEAAGKAGLTIEELRSVGGGARSVVWSGIKADVLGIPVAIPERAGGATFGDAVLAGIGAGLIREPRDFLEGAVRIRRRFEPRGERRAIYDERYEIYRQLYDRLKPVFDRAAQEMR